MDEKTEKHSFDELICSLETAKLHPEDTAWNIYHYLKDFIGKDSSANMRTLLLSYLKIPVERPSLIHSCILSMALKMQEAYADFRFPQFLEYWGYGKMLRSEDMQRQRGKDGKEYLSLKERVDRRLESWLLHHPNDVELINKLLKGATDKIKTAYATKVFEKENGGKKRRFVKLVCADGQELIADSHQFPCKPWEIQCRLFDLLIQVSKEGNTRASEVVGSQKRLQDVFPQSIGYIDGIDEGHGHYHVFDSLSRHFVAEKPPMPIKHGDFVVFAPIIPAKDKFKSAAVIKTLGREEGLSLFGTYTASITFLNIADGYLRYKITSPIDKTPEGEITPEGFASLVNMAEGSDPKRLAVGDTVNLLLYLRRNKEGKKTNHVAQIII